MSSGMKYMMRTPDGNEYGPVDQEGLLGWAQSGRITADCEIRNMMMTKWNPAAKVPFLKAIIEKQLEKRPEDISLKSKLSNIVSKGAGDKSQPSLKVRLVPGPLGLRFTAWLFDAVILGIIGFVLLYGVSMMLNNGMSENIAFTGFTLLYAFFILMYYTVTMGFMAQSVGQMFWGLMVVRPNGEPVLMGRAFAFSLFYLLFFWSTLLFTFCLPSKRALQDIFSGIRVVRTSSAGG